MAAVSLSKLSLFAAIAAFALGFVLLICVDALLDTLERMRISVEKK